MTKKKLIFAGCTPRNTYFWPTALPLPTRTQCLRCERVLTAGNTSGLCWKCQCKCAVCHIVLHRGRLCYECDLAMKGCADYHRRHPGCRPSDAEAVTRVDEYARRAGLHLPLFDPPLGELEAA